MAKWLSMKDLCALCFLFVHPLFAIPGPTGQEESILIRRIYAFSLYQEKALRSLRTLRLILDSSLEGAETFIISDLP